MERDLNQQRVRNDNLAPRNPERTSPDFQNGEVNLSQESLPKVERPKARKPVADTSWPID